MSENKQGNGASGNASITRRKFIKGAALAGAAVATAGALGTLDAKPVFAAAGIPDKWDKECDLIVVGTGTAQAGALKALAMGAKVIIVEKGDKCGGTTAMSGGSVWVPASKITKGRTGEPDTREAALKYMTKVANGRSTPEIINAYLDNVPEMADFLATTAGFTWSVVGRTDYHSEWPGATMGVRTVQADKPAGVAATDPAYSGGAAYQTPITAAIKKLGAEILLKTAATRLVARQLDDGRMEVLGVVAKDANGAILNIKARKGVLLGCGGFEWNEQMKQDFILMPTSRASMAVPEGTGDGHLMAMAVGAYLTNMQLGWGNCTFTVPGEENYKAKKINTSGSTYGAQSAPGSMFVNRKGQRFCDEAADYDANWYGFQGQECSGEMEYTNIPAWYICDQKCRESQAMMFGVYPKDAVPAWVTKADTLEELAAKLKIDAAILAATVKAFNESAAKGKDPEFHRGESKFDQGGVGRPKQTLGPVATPPFYGAEIMPMAQSTKGGVKVNEKGQAIHVMGKIIPRLYACGNNTGTGTPGHYYTGAGGIVTPGMAMAYAAAKDVVKLEDWK